MPPGVSTAMAPWLPLGVEGIESMADATLRCLLSLSGDGGAVALLSLSMDVDGKGVDGVGVDVDDKVVFFVAPALDLRIARSFSGGTVRVTIPADDFSDLRRSLEDMLRER